MKKRVISIFMLITLIFVIATPFSVIACDGEVCDEPVSADCERMAIVEELNYVRFMERFGTSDLATAVELYGADAVNSLFEEIALEAEERWNELLESRVGLRAQPCPVGCGRTIWTETNTSQWRFANNQRLCIHGFIGVADIEESRTVTLIDRCLCGWASQRSFRVEFRWRCPGPRRLGNF